jgi:hypothetical protein
MWMETTCTASFPTRPPRLRFTGQPEIVTTPRKSWRDNVEARVRFAIREMIPDTHDVIEGVSVRSYPTVAGQYLRYAVNGARCKDFEAAVCAVCEIVGRRE